MASYNPVIKNGANGAIFYVSLAPRTANGQWQSNPTLAAGDVKISLDGGAFANLGTLPSVEPAAGKAVKVTLSQAETNADNLVIIFSDAAGPIRSMRPSVARIVAFAIGAAPVPSNTRAPTSATMLEGA